MAEPVRLRSKLPVGAIGSLASGWWAMVFVIFTEGSLFGYLLFSYYYLAAQPHLPGTFPEGGLPSLTLAIPNTIILLLSSAAVAWAQAGVERNKKSQLVVGLAVALLLGLAFLVVQWFEWADKPFTLASTAYSSLYFVVTGFHMAHVVVGVIILAALLTWSVLGYFDNVRFAHVHIGGIYWHFVDAVWIAVFFTFYITPYLGLAA